MGEPLRIMTIVGARPQFIKAAALGRAFAGPFAGRIQESLLHTGQHFDPAMSEVFFGELGLQQPAVRLEALPERASHIGRMMAGVERELERQRPHLVLVYGDTNSTLAGAMAACRMGVPVAHVEAGLRSFDSSMPEEENRQLTDHASTWLFCPTASSVAHLADEGITGTGGHRPRRRDPVVSLVGDVMLDNTRYYTAQARTRPVVDQLGLRGRSFALATIHRAGTVDDPAILRGILAAFSSLHATTGLEVILPLHPRTARTVNELGEGAWHGVHLVRPIGYIDMLALVDASRLVLTDSGGLQKEACFLGKHCLVLRERTEWVELLSCGSVLVGTDAERIVSEARRILSDDTIPVVDAFGDGHAAERICTELLKYA